MQQVGGFLFADRHLGRVALVLAIGGADHGEAVQIGDGEDDAAVFVLQDVGVLAFVQLRHDDVAALDQADTVGRLLFQVVLDEARYPGAGCVHQGAGADRIQAAVAALQVQVPESLAATGADAAGAGMDVGAVLAGGDRVEHHQARIVHRAVGVLEATADLGLQRAAAGEAQAARGGQLLALAEVIVEEQAGTDHPGRAQVRTVRQDEAQRLDDVRRLGQQDLALGQGFADQAEFVVFEVAQAAVDQLAAGRGGVLGQVVLFAKEHGQAAPGCVGGDPYTVDAAADHGDIVDFGEWSGGGVRLTHVKGPEVESERSFVRIRK